MKLIRFGEVGKEKPGVQLENGTRLDVSAFGRDYNEDFFGTDGLVQLKDWLAKNESSCPKVDNSVRLGAPLVRPSKIVCVGLNYAKHAAESGMAVPKEPVLFFKATSAIVGPNDDVVIPKGSQKTDWEVELAVVIGKKASYVSEADALDHVAGYVLHNDYSERAFQIEREGQWVKGKSCDTFAPVGPFIATKDEIKDPNNLHLWLKLNGETVQDSSTSDFIFNVQEVVSYISQFMTLLPGDIISTGTPFGVGLGFNPPKYLKAGDVVELGIEGLGTSKQTAKAYSGK
ncbi:MULTISPECIES: fumarylacetoacetate hydrolase family protein [Arenibacter]|jgi:2-keto-4-pentenoate hydratase/2-oxohepta-3-ene-1,7-dioic acid hydratase in catechol pathway|uniref:fumarylacetoacetate hydrolase family protein n=1 Tax=Arenibacter TaxID=178469 RepID=UPI0004DFB041|nr:MULTISPECIES: fumarylacetoacetate hydrolase family protein [Arenibacter]MDX1759408.1 fumarylacetoacetate hydrolase family protein [Arenibacter algicola]GBF21968.1 ureidoglycolate lyase [Arenibacter sp. NBRC 103722]HCO84420.1 FAA hydrolase family protein [Arenibacter sp.]|tara:strand:- start:17332 stop:18192 length:861 start_codon:yes stop_codon:yes gene_type:complete